MQIDGLVELMYHCSPGELIISCIDRYKASQIVMGSRGLGVISRTILGSVSHYVINHTNIPVTVIPRDTKDSFLAKIFQIRHAAIYIVDHYT